MKTYKGKIESLLPFQCMVFGANKLGFHGAGAAGFASFGVAGNVWREYNYAEKPYGWLGKWNVKGIGEGYQEGTEGRSYALPTVTKPGARRSMSLREIAASVDKFYRFARRRPDMEFLVSYSEKGGLNGYTPKEMASVFAGDIPENVLFEEGFAKLIEETSRTVMD